MKRSRVLVAIFVFCLVTVFPFSRGAAEEPQLVDRTIAVVGDDIILESEVLQFVQDIVLQDPSQYQSKEAVDQLKSKVLNELIQQKILVAAAMADTNIKVDDREVDQTLDARLNQIIEQVGGEEKLVEYFGKPIRQIRREFRKQVRESLLAERIRNMRMQNVTISKPEVEEFYRKNESKLPELPERVRLAHILIKIEPTEEAQRRAKERADSLYKLLLEGEDFAILAMENSDDPATRDKGGLLGTTERGDLVPEYEAVAFGLEEGEISEPVRSRFGYHIIKLNWRRGEKINTSHILCSLIPTAEDEKRARDFAAELRQRIMEGGDFAQIAREYSQDEETAKLGGDLGWFELPNVADEYRVIVQNLEPGEVSQPFKTRFGIQLLKLVERADKRPMDLRKDWERISRMALAEKQDRELRKWLDEQRQKVYVEIFTD